MITGGQAICLNVDALDPCTKRIVKHEPIFKAFTWTLSKIIAVLQCLKRSSEKWSNNPFLKVGLTTYISLFSAIMVLTVFYLVVKEKQKVRPINLLVNCSSSLCHIWYNFILSKLAVDFVIFHIVA